MALRRYQFSLDVFVYESTHVVSLLSQVGAKARLWNLERDLSTIPGSLKSSALKLTC